jgi:hypothetical protein
LNELQIWSHDVAKMPRLFMSNVVSKVSAVPYDHVAAVRVGIRIALGRPLFFFFARRLARVVTLSFFGSSPLRLFGIGSLLRSLVRQSGASAPFDSCEHGECDCGSEEHARHN